MFCKIRSEQIGSAKAGTGPAPQMCWSDGVKPLIQWLREEISSLWENLEFEQQQSDAFWNLQR